MLQSSPEPKLHQAKDCMAPGWSRKPAPGCLVSCRARPSCPEDLASVTSTWGAELGSDSAEVPVGHIRTPELPRHAASSPSVSNGAQESDAQPGPHCWESGRHGVGPEIWGAQAGWGRPVLVSLCTVVAWAALWAGEQGLPGKLGCTRGVSGDSTLPRPMEGPLHTHPQTHICVHALLPWIQAPSRKPFPPRALQGCL